MSSNFNVTFSGPVGVVQSDPGSTATVFQDGERMTVVATSPEKTSAEACEEALKQLEYGYGRGLVATVRARIAELEAELESERNWAKGYFDQRNAAQAKVDELEAQVPRWIPVSERLPDSTEDVLSDGTWGYAVGLFLGSMWSLHGGDLYSNCDDIERWMPLPPKEGSE